MDNDLMARRLRPPSEPAQAAPLSGPFILPEYVEQEAPSFHDWPPAPPSGETAAPPPAADLAEAWAPLAHEDVAPEDARVLDAVSAEVDEVAEVDIPEAAVSSESALTDESAAEIPPAYETPPWSTQARDEVPWDRPSDYDQPTDTATPDQPSWDRPAPELWADSDLVDDPATDVFGSVADANDERLPYWPDTTAGQRAALASTPRIEEAPAIAGAASDPDDAYAPVLGDIATPVARAWPEMNGNRAGRNDATVVVEAIAQTVEPAQAPVDVRGDTDDSNGLTPEPAPSEWVRAASESTEFAEPTPDNSPEQAPAAYADANPDPEAPDAAPTAVPDAEPDAEHGPTVAPEQAVPAPSRPLILRIELAIVDDSRLVVGAANATWRVNDVNAVVLEVGQSDPAPEAEAATPHHPAFEPRGNNDGELDEAPEVNTPAPVPSESTWLGPTLPALSADHAFPAAPLDPPPWLDPTELAGPEPAPWDRPAEPATSASPDSSGLASVPPVSTLPPPWAQSPLPAQTTHWPPDDFAPSGRQPEMDPFTGVRAAPQASAFAAPEFAAPDRLSHADRTALRLDVGRSAFAPPISVERELAEPAPSGTATRALAPAVVQEQSDLWFLSTEPADEDGATADEATAAKEPSSMLTAGLTIAFAVLVIVLVLVFIQLMTSLLG